MPTILLKTIIQAPITRCFDLSRSIDLHKISTAQSSEEAIAGVTTGLIGLNETVTWEAWHFGMRLKLTSKITEFQSPHYFVDEMVVGPFESMRHVHRFEETIDGTLMIDEFTYVSPYGKLGKLVDCVFLRNYMRNFLMNRNDFIKAVAESDRWSDFVKE